MHYACAYGFPAVLKVLYEHDDTCIHAQDKNGRFPAHFAMSNAINAATPRVLRFLLQVGGTGIIKTRATNGNLPIHLLVSTARNCPDEQDKKRNIIETMRTFLDTQPKIDAEMFGAIQSLPTWLRDHVVIHSHMQTILNRKAAKPHHCLLLFCDLLCHILLILGFEISTRYAISKLSGKSPEEPSVPIQFLLVSAAWFLLRELIQICGLLNLGKNPFRNYKFYLNLMFIASIITFSILINDVKMDSRILSNLAFSHVVAIFKLIYIVNFVFFIRSLNKTFAVFASGVIYVFKQLWAFLVMLILILFMFSLAFHFLTYNRQNFCTEKKSLDACKIPYSWIRMLSMMMGEMNNLLDDYKPMDKYWAVHLFYVIYAAVVVVVMSNMLIAITTQSYKFIKNERAVMVFWSNRLDQVAQNDAVFSLLRRLFMCQRGEEVILGPTSVREHPGGRPAVTETDRSQNTHKGFQGSLYYLWEELIGVYSNENIDVQNNSYCNVDFILLTITRIVVCIVIPIWLIIGVLSLSVLWPPQIRERMLGMEMSTESSNATEKEIWSEFNRLKKDMTSLRKKLKEDMKVDRAELDSVNFEVVDVKNNVVEDMVQVKEIMTSLLDQMKTELAKRQHEFM